MRALLVIVALAQFTQRPALTPAETLIAPDILRTIERASVEGSAVTVIQGSDPSSGEIALVCKPGHCEAVQWAARKLGPAIAAKQIPAPSRTIRVVSAPDSQPAANTKAAVFVAESNGPVLKVVRGLWSTAGINDEVVELFAHQAVATVDARAFESVGQPQWDVFGVPTTAVVPPKDATDLDRASFIAAASAYFLATLPNAGAEALLSHLMVGAHARLSEDGRKAVALMGSQQRASGEVLMMFAQAIEREQRRFRSFERYMPTPVDPMLHSRIADMEKGITGVWSSIGITGSPFVPAAERIRGRGGEDLRIATRTPTTATARVDPPTAFLMQPDVTVVLNELASLIDGKRSVSDIRDALSAEFGSLPLPSVTDYFDRLAKTGAITIK
jgi:hypothetical protein